MYLSEDKVNQYTMHFVGEITFQKTSRNSTTRYWQLMFEGKIKWWNVLANS